MAATVATFFDNQGVDGTPANFDDTSGLGPPNIRFKTADDSLINTSNPIPIPTGGPNFSFWKQLYMQVVTAGGFSQINNVKFFTDNTPFGTGIVTSVGDQDPINNSGAPGSGYIVAVGVVGTSGTEMITGHSGISSKTDAFSYRCVLIHKCVTTNRDNQ